MAPSPENPWHVYILECADGTFYCGIAKDPAKRLEEHNGALPGGARYTRGRRPVRLLAGRECESKSEALKFELAIKALPREKKLPFLQTGSLVSKDVQPTTAPCPTLSNSAAVDTCNASGLTKK
jgi:putative endonuclease